MRNIEVSQNGFGYTFDSSKCMECQGNCCVGESGYIWINPQEMQELANHLNLTIDELKERYLIKIKYKYSIKEVQLSQDNNACIFFDIINKRCSIYEKRPTQCRTFPFWEYFKDKPQEVQKECPAIKII